jgi:parallel beta-helix repeat protein
MKLRYQIFSVLMCLALSAGAAFGQLSGTKTIGSSGDYATFAAAIADLNAQGVVAPGVTFVIANGTYTDAQQAINIAINQPTASAPVVFKPDVGATVVWNLNGQTSGNKYGLRIGDGGAFKGDYITLDGSNTVGGTTRDWTIIASDAANGFEPIDIWGDNVTVKNCIIKCAPGLEMSSTVSYGVSIREASPTAMNATIQNNKITSNYPISVGRVAGAVITGTTIVGNELHGWKKGIYLLNSGGIQILNNDIAGDVTTAWVGSTYGIDVGTATTGTTDINGNSVHNWGSNVGVTAASNIYGMNVAGPGTFYIRNNKVYSIMNGTTDRTTTNVSSVGIFMSNAAGPNTYYVYNNMLYGFDDTSTVLNGGFTAGIRTGGSSVGTLYMYNNSVYMKNVSPRTHNTAAFLISGSASLSVSFKNNIGYTSTTGFSATVKSYVFNKGGSSVLTSDYNDFYNDGGAFAQVTSAGDGTFATWVAGGQDAHSVSICPAAQFGDPGQWTSMTNLHWNGKPSNTFVASVLGAPYNTDIDGDTRSGSAPYLGADEIAGSPLPVELTSFTARATSKGAVLAWQTATEVNNRGFAIERRAMVSGSSTNWQQVGFVSGAGTSNAAHSYSYSDQLSMPGKYAYRLKQVDNDGASKYYNQIEVELGAVREFRLYGNYPNPFNPSTAIRFTVAQDGQAEMKIFNAIGQEVATVFNGFAQAGSMQQATFNASAMPSGMYFARLKSGNAVSVIKMMLMK